MSPDSRPPSPVPRLAMKVYDYQWATTYGMSPQEAAAQLHQDGVSTVLVRNAIDPLPNSGVDQEAYLAGGQPLPSDRAWSDALREAGLEVVQTTALFFDPELVRRFPDARPIAANGQPSAGFDWYLGACPTHEGFLATKIARLRQVVGELEPDGIFLSFTRFPGFWENWVPQYAFSNADRFCFCPRCRAKFAEECGIALPSGGVTTQALVILTAHADAWNAWRCQQVIAAISAIAQELRRIRSSLSITLNTLPFPTREFAGQEVRRTIAAQDLGLLGDVVDRFELMTYLQILARSDAWLQPVLTDARALVPDRPLLCTLQVAPLYTEGVHAGRGRPTAISAEELDATARAALQAGADGLVFYHWTDFLDDAAQGGSKRAVLRGLSAP